MRSPRRARSRAASVPGAVLGAALALLAAGGAGAQVADTSFVRWELGGTSDLTNERFYEETYDDTLFTGRRLSSSPEYRSAGVGAVELSRAFVRGSRLRFRQEATAGDHVLRSFTRLEWQGEPRDGMRAILAPELDVRRDRSFGADRRELRFRPDARLRFTSLDRSQTWSMLAGGDWYRTSGTSDVLSLDRNAGRAWLRYGYTPLDAAWETELGYGADVRAFPDSTVRDHVEQHAALMLRRMLPGSGSAAVEVQLDRRTTLYATPSTRDHFWSGRVDANAFVPFTEKFTAEVWLSADGYRYDRPDTSVYFDYRVWTVRPALHWSLAGSWGLRAGPRLEILDAPEVSAERYRQVAAVLEFERLHAGDWWSIAPSAGWREYDRSAATLSLANPDLHSSYLFVEGDVFADVGLPGRVRLRLSGSGRIESHEDPSQDASSLYVALDVRRRF
jgi:hypothetical protein